MRLVEWKVFEPWPFLLSWCPTADEDLLKLLLLVLAHKEWHAGNYLAEDATHRPHIDASRVVLAPKQDVRCAIPKCNNFVGEVLDWDSECSCEAEVCELEYFVIFDQKVLGFQVPVQDFVLVALLHAGEQLIEEDLKAMLTGKLLP